MFMMSSSPPVHHEVADRDENETGTKRLDVIDANHERKSTVRFAPSCQVLEYVAPLDEMSATERAAIWWQEEDYYAFKATARQICRESRQRRDDRLLLGLDQSFNNTRRFITTENENTSLDQVSADAGLIQYCTHAHSRRGLERWISKLHGQVRSQAASKNIQTVVQHSAVLPEEELSILAQEQSFLARVLARQVGDADALAVKSLPKYNRMDYLKTRHQLAQRCQATLRTNAAAAQQNLEPLSLRGR